MTVFLGLLLAVYILWMLAFRSAYIAIRYHKEKGFQIKKEIDREELMYKLKNELNYPGLKEIAYDEMGQIALFCTFGCHTIRQTPDMLFVGKGERKGSSRKQALYLEEAECLKAYIQKLYNPDADTNPHKMYKRLKNYRRNSIITTTTILLAFIIAFVSLGNENGLMDGMQSKNISTSYLSEYSTNVTIGNAFNAFFSEPEWTTYKEGAQELVDFKGGCMYDDKKVTIIITFLINGDEFIVDSVKMNGEEMPDLFTHGLFAKIFAENDAESYTNTQENTDNIENTENISNTELYQETSSEKRIVEIYQQYFEPAEYAPTIYMYDDGTFRFEYNTSEGMSKYIGKWTKSNSSDVDYHFIIDDTEYYSGIDFHLLQRPYYAYMNFVSDYGSHGEFGMTQTGAEFYMYNEE